MTVQILLLLLIPFGLFGQQDPLESQKLAPYYPTPAFIVQKMLDLGELKAGEMMYDLGSGDGRIVVMAAKEYKANATGIELDPDLCVTSRVRIKKLGLEERARIVEGDILVQDYSPADLVTVYLLPTSNEKVRPILEQQLKKGARIVCHDFDISSWTADRVEHIEDDGEGRSHTLYLYRR